MTMMILHAHSFQTTFYSFNHLFTHIHFTLITTRKTKALRVVYVFYESVLNMARTYSYFTLTFPLLPPPSLRPVPNFTSLWHNWRENKRNSEIHTHTPIHNLHKDQTTATEIELQSRVANNDNRVQWTKYKSKHSNHRTFYFLFSSCSLSLYVIFAIFPFSKYHLFSVLYLLS